MANPNKPFGFQVLNTEGKEARVRYYAKTASAVIYPGDVLKMVAAGTVEPAAAGDVMIGVAMIYSAAADTSKVAVVDDADAVFAVQMSGTYADADAGLNANIVATTGDTVLKLSKMALNTTGADVTATLQFKILGLLEKGENAVGNYAIVRVKPNHHAFHADVAGI